jgi:LacI family transcriptional regulator
MITIKDIAKIAGVSPSTVSKALNNRHDISEETKKKVLQIVAENKFSPNVFGKNLKSKTTGNIGVIFCREQNPLSSNPFYSRVLEGVEAELAINNYNLMLTIVHENSKDDLPKVIRERQIDGIILIGIFKTEFVDQIFADEKNIDIIMVDPKLNFNQCSQILIDNEHGAFVATQYLIDAGHKKIGFVSGDLDRQSFKQRFDGYEKALKYNKLSVDSNLIRSGGLEEGYNHTKNILSAQRATAIFFANDINAHHGYKAIHDLNLKVPDDISIVGFDDIWMSKISSPPLTTIRVYKEELGSIAVRMLMRSINNEIDKPINTIVPVKLIERESVKKLIE